MRKKFGIILSIFLIILGIILILKQQYRLALLPIVLGIFGVVQIVYITKKNIKPFEKGWTNKNIFFLILFLIVIISLEYFLFNQGFNLYGLIFIIPFIIIIWLYESYVERHWKEIQSKRKVGFSERLSTGVMGVLMFLILVLSSLIIMEFFKFLPSDLILIFIVIDFVLILTFVLVYCLKRKYWSNPNQKYKSTATQTTFSELC